MPKTTTTFAMLIVMLCMLQFGCARIKTNRRFYRTFTGNFDSVADSAQRKNAEAICRLRAGDLCAAQQLVNEALVSDSSFGPAHNTLGKIYFHQRKYYQAAWEFEFAKDAMPERIEPLNNLGLVYERVGRYERAIEYYEQALEMSPDTAEVLGNLIRTKLARGDTPFSIEDEINHLILIDDRPTWVNWVKLKLLSDPTEQNLLQEQVDSLTLEPPDMSFDDLESSNEIPSSRRSYESLPSEYELEPYVEFDELPTTDENLTAPAFEPNNRFDSIRIEELSSPSSVLEGSSSR